MIPVSEVCECGDRYNLVYLIDGIYTTICFPISHLENEMYNCLQHFHSVFTLFGTAVHHSVSSFIFFLLVIILLPQWIVQLILLKSTIYIYLENVIFLYEIAKYNMTFVTFLLHSFIHPVSQRASQPASYSFWLHRFFWSLPLGYHLLLNNRGFLIVHLSGSGERMNNNNNKCRHNLPRRRRKNSRHQGNPHPGNRHHQQDVKHFYWISGESAFFRRQE